MAKDWSLHKLQESYNQLASQDIQLTSQANRIDKGLAQAIEVVNKPLDDVHKSRGIPVKLATSEESTIGLQIVQPEVSPLDNQKNTQTGLLTNPLRPLRVHETNHNQEMHHGNLSDDFEEPFDIDFLPV